MQEKIMEKDKEILFKALCNYLPYGLEIINNVNKKRELTIEYLNYWNDIEFKPILRPLSDLGQGKKHILELRSLENNDMLLWGLQTEVNFIESYNSDLTHSVMQYLIENHFDVFGLINEGLAININTL